jgi:hypothetical protein
MNRSFWLACCSLFVGGTFAHAQTLKQAKSWYLQNNFQKALPVFEREIRLKPKDPSLNLWYGACLLETGKKAESVKHLILAKEKRLPDAEYFLSKYLFLSDNPDSALVVLRTYIQDAGPQANRREQAIELQNEIENTVSELRKVEDITLIDSIVVPRSALYTTVRLSPDAGTFVPVRTAFPNQNKAVGGAYLPERNDRALYADPIPEKGLDLVTRHRLLNDWDNAEPLSDIINSVSDEVNPYLLSDGTTLYFASNRPGGMGGLDLYVTRLGKNGNYLLPNRLNMPFNSKGNDYFLLIDEFKNRGYFATDRNQPKGYAVIYTFLPNPNTVLVQGKSLKELNDLAAIRSIRATWAGKNMDSLLNQTVEPVQKSQQLPTTAAFVLNDRWTCSSESDFVSEQARNQFREYAAQTEQLARMETQLEQLRSAYMEAAPDRQKVLSPEILRLETAVLERKKSLPAMENTIRTLELTARSK